MFLKPREQHQPFLNQKYMLYTWATRDTLKKVTGGTKICKFLDSLAALKALNSGSFRSADTEIQNILTVLQRV